LSLIELIFGSPKSSDYEDFKFMIGATY